MTAQTVSWVFPLESIPFDPARDPILDEGLGSEPICSRILEASLLIREEGIWLNYDYNSNWHGHALLSSHPHFQRSYHSSVTGFQHSECTDNLSKSGNLWIALSYILMTDHEPNKRTGIQIQHFQEGSECPFILHAKSALHREAIHQGALQRHETYNWNHSLYTNVFMRIFHFSLGWEEKKSEMIC